jgi:hypothetical protein
LGGSGILNVDPVVSSGPKSLGSNSSGVPATLPHVKMGVDPGATNGLSSAINVYPFTRGVSVDPSFGTALGVTA